MLFSLEALQADKGDSLILHYGKETSPRFLVIDGGPAGVYESALRPRLQQIHKRWKREDDGKLDIEMVMVSHIDDDHIRGILAWMAEIGSSAQLEYNILTIWHNSFDDVIGNASDELQSRLASLATETLDDWQDREGLQPMSAAVLAGVGQGRKLRSMARKLGIPVNRGFQGLVSAAPERKSVIPIGAGLVLQVLCPTMSRLQALHDSWEETIRRLDKASTAEIAAFVDQSVANLSSMVVLAAVAGKRMLLTGDARGDHILEGLESAGLLTPAGAIHVEVFKVPHHGSNRNSDLSLFERITADHYVISANGEHENPDPEVFEWIAKARGDAAYTIHITNKNLFDPKKNKDVGAAVQAALDRNPAPNRKVAYRKDDHLSLRVDLGAALSY